jgi:hypothetical protein
MTQPNRDPDEVSHQKELEDSNYHDEEPEVANDEVRGPRKTLMPRNTPRRPPPRKRHYED